jgi:NADH oxidase (H2O2-forming)
VRKVVIIGGSAAGMVAAIAAAKENSDVEVTVITMDRLPYRRPAIPALIAGAINEPEDAKVFSAEVLAGYNIKIICLSEAVDIDTANNVIFYVSDGYKEKISYDSAVIATGSTALIPRIAGSDKKGVCTFTTFESAAEIVERAGDADCAVVVGASFIALEVAEALMHKGLDVYFNVRSRILRKLLEPDISDFLIKRFEQQGLKMLTGEAISQIAGEQAVEYVVHKNKKIAANLVVMGTGVKPNVALATKCGIELGQSGAIKVDNRMRTSVPNIYAAGDCAESPDLGTGMFVYSPVGSIGAMAGKIAGRNAAGADVKTKGFLRAQADQILGMQIYSIGHSTTTAKEVDLQVQVHNLDAGQPDLQEYKQRPFETAKLLTDNKDKIVGAQLVAKKFGSQFAWQLYQAVLNGQSRKEFLASFISPRAEMAKILMDTDKPAIVVKGIGKDKSLVLKETADRQDED